jgi:DNA mismatch repair protein MutL
MSGHIVKLPDAVANQIAAGEVVERPVAVVKELVENALDAGARSIEIQFEKGGKSLIRVLDDGVGMSAEDAVIALQRHATSKIRDVADILRIGSFGFRGEALPSIASVSKFTLRTRPKDAPEGIEIRVDGGKEPVAGACGMSPGTEVTVANLFHSVPVRRKFMKTDRTESAHILQMCRLIAVAHPEVGFSLIEDGHEVFNTPACPDRIQRVREIFGKRRVEDLIPLAFERDGLRIHGLIGRPGVGRSTRAEMITYVNLRPVDSRLLNYALIESYHRYLPRGRYPVAFLFVDLPAGDVDVNVHPTKREVRFRAEPVVRGVVMTALTEHLGEVSRQSLRHAEPVTPSPSIMTESERSAPPKPFIVPSQSVEKKPFPEIRDKPYRPPEPSIKPPARASEGQEPVEPSKAVWRYCGVYRNQVGLFESPDGLVLLNAKAARERILFERIEQSLEGEMIPRQPLLIPPMLELSPLDATLLADQIDFFRKMGFEIEPFGRHLFRIREVPAWVESSQAENLVEELIEKIRDRGIRTNELQPARSVVARMIAAREARGFRVSGTGEWESLVESLLKCDNPLLDARGRPAFVEMRHGELSRKLMLEGLPGALESFDNPG